MLLKFCSVAHAKATVDGDDGAGDIPRLCEEQRGPRDVLSLAKTCCRDTLLVSLDDLLVQHGGHVGLDEPGCDHVGGDIPRTQLAGEAAGHADQRGLGRRVVDLPGRSEHPNHGRDQDDAPETCLGHGARRTPHHPEGACQVGVDHRVPVGVRHARQQVVLRDTSVGNEHSHGAKFSLHRLEGGIHLGLVRDIAFNGQHAARNLTPCAASACDAVSRVTELLGYDAADAARRPGNENNRLVLHGLNTIVDAVMASRPMPEGLSRVVSWLRCPICMTPLTVAGRTLSCDNRHCFDVARQGHLNLLLRGTPQNADTPEMVAARERFLSEGWYDPLIRKVVTALSGARRVLEVGSGTGHYIGAFLDASARSLGLATDISPAACRRAARRSPRLGAVVADVWSGLPVATAVLDAVLCVFAPRNPAEFARLVFPGGRLVVVTPRSDHLRELREAFGLLSIGREKLDRLDSSMTSFDLMDREELTLPLELSAEAAASLVAMGPNAFHEHTKTSAARTTAAFTISTFQRS